MSAVGTTYFFHVCDVIQSRRKGKEVINQPTTKKREKDRVTTHQKEKGKGERRAPLSTIIVGFTLVPITKEPFFD